MKILHLIFSLELGGTEAMLIDIVNEQSKNARLYVAVVNSKINGELISNFHDSVPVFRFERKEGSVDPAVVVRLNRLIATIRPDVIHCHNHKLIKLVLIGRRKTVLTVHDVGYPADCLGRYRRRFAISKAVQKDLMKRANLTSDVVYNGVKFDQIAKKKSYRHPGTFRFIQVSRLVHEKKGQDLLLQAVKFLLDAGENVKVDFVGKGTSECHLRHLVSDLGIEKNICFLGEKDRAWIYENLWSYDALVQPSRYEGFGLTCIEGIAAGLPVVASCVDGPAEILGEFKSSYLFEKENVDDLARQMKCLMDAYSSGQIESACLNSLKEAGKKYSITTTARKYLNEYSFQ